MILAASDEVSLFKMKSHFCKYLKKLTFVEQHCERETAQSCITMWAATKTGRLDEMRKRSMCPD